MEGRSMDDDQPCEFRAPYGVKHDARQAGGGSQPEERHALAAEVLNIGRRWKAR
jgi:hypothetical protein